MAKRNIKIEAEVSYFMVSKTWYTNSLKVGFRSPIDLFLYLEPLAEIAGDTIHPILGISIKQLNLKLKDNKSVRALYHYRLSELRLRA